MQPHSHPCDSQNRIPPADPVPNSRGADPLFAECNSPGEAIHPFRELHRIGFTRQTQPAEFAGSKPTRSSTLRLIHPFPIQTLKLYEGQIPRAVSPGTRLERHPLTPLLLTVVRLLIAQPRGCAMRSPLVCDVSIALQ